MQLFRKSHELENKITSFLDNIIKSGNLFTKAFQSYLKKSVSSEFLKLKEQVSSLESKNDALRRDVENQLYAHMLLPDMRSDILQIIEGCDKIINKYESDLILLSVEKNKIPTELKEDLINLVKINIHCVDTLIHGIQVIMNGQMVKDFIQEVYMLEHKVDLLAIDLKQQVFIHKKLNLACQLQLKEFIYSIEKISDMAEDMADMISVFVVKHAA